MGHCKSSAKGKVHSNTGLPQETRKSQLNNLTLHLKQQLEVDMEQQTGSELEKEYIKAVYCHSAYLTYMQSTS